MLEFVLKLLLTNILFSLVIAGGLVRLNQKNRYGNFELILYSLGLGPAFTVLLLYYLFLLLPGHSNLFYLLVVFTVYGLLFVLSWQGFRALGVHFKEWLQSSAASLKNLAPRQRIIKITAVLLLLAIVGSVLVYYAGNTLHTPIDQHDALVYGNFGKMYYQHKQVVYTKVMKPARNGFYFQGSQRPSFSLLLTWEMLLNRSHTNERPYFDMYFRSSSGYFGLLLIILYVSWLYRKSKLLALLGILVLFAGLQFFLMLVNYHLDSYRVFFLSVSWIWLAYSLKNRDYFSLFMLGIFSGFAGFAHLIGLAAALVNALAFILFYAGSLKTRLAKVAVLGLIILALGNFHYLLEIFFGSVSGFVSYI